METASISLMGTRNAIMVCVAVAALVVLGLVMLASTSPWIEDMDSQYKHLTRQSIMTAVGAVGAVLLAFTDYRLLRKYSGWVFAGACFLLILCYVPGIAVEQYGESRWIKLPGIRTFQPSEAAKIAIMVGLASWFARYQSETRKCVKGFLIPGCILAIPLALIFFEKDMGTAAGLGAAGFALMFVAGCRLFYLLPSAVIALSALYVVVKHNPERWERLMSFMDLEATKLGAGHQQWRGLLALGNGGVDGVGLGNGAEKHGYLPFAHTDFIFPIIGEELGIWFTLGTVFAFVMIAVYGVAIAVHSSDIFGRLLAVGLTCAIVFPAIMNIAVTTALIPNTGLPLPFVSYGGTNLVFTLAAVGVLMSIHRQANFARKHEDSLIHRDRGDIRL